MSTLVNSTSTAEDLLTGGAARERVRRFVEAWRWLIAARGQIQVCISGLRKILAEVQSGYPQRSFRIDTAAPGPAIAAPV